MKLSRIHFLLLCILLLVSCAKKKKVSTTIVQETKKNNFMASPEFQTILDSSKLKGAIVVYDLQADTYHSNDFEWAEIQRLPASTFKIPNSLIALEIGVVENDSTLFRWDGKKRYLKIWEQDLSFKKAFHFSCVPCYQEVARKIGAKRMNEYLNKFDYGLMRLDSTNIDNFWLEGDSKISPLQQIHFLKRFYEAELPISKRTQTIMKDLMVMEKNEFFTLSGKTGWAIRGDSDNGWFVGLMETKEKRYLFATNVEPLPDFDMAQFAAIRKEITVTALEQMGILD